MLKRVTAFLLLCILILIINISLNWYQFRNRPIVLQTVTFTVRQGVSVRHILRDLSKEPSLASFSPQWAEFFIRAQGLGTKIQAGEYEFQPNLSLSAMMSKALAGDVKLYPLTLIEGSTFKDLWLRMEQTPEIVKTLPEGEAAILSALGLKFPSLEGLFFPETYYFPKGTTDREFLLRAHGLMLKKVEAAWQVRSGDITLDTPYQAMILASIIEKESSRADEWPVVSQVFHNRLQKKMRLQADPTVIYGMGASFTGKLSRADLQRPTPYNTYTEFGLPPTPIAMPSFGTLLATCNPTPGDYLYFVADKQGYHHFSQTLDAHEENVKAYQLSQLPTEPSIKKDATEAQ